MDLLVLGGTQFVGRHLVDAAIGAGHSVTLFNRGRTGSDLFPEARRLVGDRNSDLSALESGEWGAVVDVNAYIPRQVRGVAQLLADRVGHYTFVSTVSVYADASAGRLDEQSALATMDDPETEDVNGETYGPLKVLCERAAQEAFPAHCTIVRPGIVAGPHDPTDRFTHWVRAMAYDGEVAAPSRPDQPVQIVDGRDLGAFLLLLTTNGVSNVFNAIGPREPMTFASMLDRCRAGTGGTATPAWGTAEDTSAGRTTPLPLALPADGSMDALFSVDTERSVEAGLRHRPVEETAADTLAWDRTRTPAT